MDGYGCSDQTEKQISAAVQLSSYGGIKLLDCAFYLARSDAAAPLAKSGNCENHQQGALLQPPGELEGVVIDFLSSGSSHDPPGETRHSPAKPF